MNSLYKALHHAGNPLFRVKRRFSRYLIIVSCTGALSFGVALLMLHAGFQPFVTLVCSVLASGLLNYGALELWGFPHRKGRLSWKRLLQNAIVGTGGFGTRYAVLTLGLHYLTFPQPFDKAIPLALAYTASFIFGYLLRSRVVFKNNSSSRRYNK